MKTARIAPAGRLSALSTASGLAISMMLATPAFAQDEDAEEDSAQVDDAAAEGNVIIVDGFRRSLENAQNIKRDADTFVDVVTAEDIGALPDRSVAESLQRVPGVNIGRFEKTSDPDRFSVEGTGVIIRGLPYVRSELNGRDIFSATGGRVLSFNDVSPELLGRVEVYKNATADMVDGGIAGLVNLVTRKPLDNPGVRLSGTVGANVGDLAEEWSPEFSLLGSVTVENSAGSLGFQLGYANSELVSRTDATQLTDPCYRADTLDGPCFRTRSVSAAGVGDPTGFDEDNFPPAGTVLSPKGAGVRTTDLTRNREAWSSVLQYESPGGDFLATFEWLRSDTSFRTEEFAVLAIVNNDAWFATPAPGSTWTFDENGVFQTGTLTQAIGDPLSFSPWLGLNTELLRFERLTEATTEDFSIDIDWNITDRLRMNFEAQSIASDLRQDAVIGTMATFSEIRIDASGKTPQVEFISPQAGPTDLFSNPDYTYYWFLLDSRARNEGDLESARVDFEYDISDEGFFRGARFGARWSDRSRITRDTNFSNWGSLGAPWTGRGGDWGGQNPNAAFPPGGGAYPQDFPNASGYRTPFGDNFQRGNAPTPLEAGGGFFFGGDDFIGEYLAGTTTRQGQEIAAFSFPDFIPGQTWSPLAEGFNDGQISDVTEETKAAYVRVDYGMDFDNGWVLEGNFGVRYVDTTIISNGDIAFPDPVNFFDGVVPGQPADGVVQVNELQFSCDNNPNPTSTIAYCGLSDARKAEFVSAITGNRIIDDRAIKFDHWLPSFNAKLDVGNGLLFRAAVSKGISRPDLAVFKAGGQIVDNTGNLLAEGTLDTGPLFQISTGNRNVQATESWNYDLSVEWYFDDVGSLTLSGFVKDLEGIVSSGTDVVEYPSGNGDVPIRINGPSNVLGGTLKGLELAYQQTYDFLPGLLSGLGTQLTYTYVDAGDFTNPDLANNRGSFASRQPLQGVSEHTVNATIFYEKGPLSARAAYNWRSEYLVTPRDDIFPFSPIWLEDTGQLDASIFYSVTDYFKLGVQGVNLLDEVTVTSQVVDFDGTRITRSAFRNDRRFTFLARFDF